MTWKTQCCKLDDCVSQVIEDIMSPSLETFGSCGSQKQNCERATNGHICDLGTRTSRPNRQCHTTLLPKPHKVCARLSCQEKAAGTSAHPYRVVFSWCESPRRLGLPFQTDLLSTKALATSCMPLPLQTDQNWVPPGSLGHQCR